MKLNLGLPQKKNKAFEPKNPNAPTRRELIRLAIEQHCRYDREWWLPPSIKVQMTIKTIVCILLGLEAKCDRPRWADLYGPDSPNACDDFWDEPVVVAMFGYNEYQHMEYTEHAWRELVVGHGSEDWRYEIRDNSAE